VRFFQESVRENPEQNQWLSDRMIVNPFESMKSSDQFWPMALEFSGSLFALYLLLPASMLIAFVIYCTGGRPIFFTEEVLVRDGGPARFYRFRTTGHGTRSFVTFGRLLRRFRIDKLPGLWNAVRGDIKLKCLLRLK
jgi:lipopolysaccharide/colanic/teichoic acid biosynthesis glycosyltransferase